MFDSFYIGWSTLAGEFSGPAFLTFGVLVNLGIVYTYLLAESVRNHHLKSLRYSYCYDGTTELIAGLRSKLANDTRVSFTLCLVMIAGLAFSLVLGIAAFTQHLRHTLPGWSAQAMVGALALLSAIAAHRFAEASHDYTIAALADEDIPWVDMTDGYWARLCRSCYFLLGAIACILAAWVVYDLIGGVYVLR